MPHAHDLAPEGRVYLDHAASAPLRSCAREALVRAAAWTGNASSPHAEGQRARAAIEEARAEVAALVGALPREVVFTSSGTEALNLAIRGVVSALAGARDHVLVSAIEHDATLRAAEALGSSGVRVTRAPCDANGRVAVEATGASVSERTALVAILHANNETGVLQPVAEIAARAHAAGALVLVDAVHAAGRVVVDRASLGADFLALSAHKIGGPQGVGALVVRRGAPLEPLLHGGGQERGLRSGTEPVALLAAFGAAAAQTRRCLHDESARLEALAATLEAGLSSLAPACRINGKAAPRVPGTTSVTFPGIDAGSLVIRLDLEGVAASTGSACASGAAEPSHVLRAMGLDEALSRATLRLSLGPSTSASDVARALAAIARALAGAEAAARRAAGTLNPATALRGAL